MPGVRAQAGDNTCFPALINLHFKPPQGGTLSDGRSGILSVGRRQLQVTTKKSAIKLKSLETQSEIRSFVISIVLCFAAIGMLICGKLRPKPETHWE